MRGPGAAGAAALVFPPAGARHRRALRRLGELAGGLVVFAFVWEIIVLLGQYPEFVLPSPLAVLERFVSAWADGTIEPHATQTLLEVAIGFASGATLGVSLGYILAQSVAAERLLSPYFVAAQATPILALAPLIALWFGSGLLSKVVICALIVFFPILVATMVGVRSVDPRLVEMARSYRATRWQLLRTVRVPAALPAIFGSLRVGVTLAVVGAIVGEWAGGERGLGVLVNLARGSLFDIPLLFATLLTIALLGTVLYGLVALIERRVVGGQG
jgi:NitT/TauT family transport system permease protein